jgi:carboxypeptidase PM20D1
MYHDISDSVYRFMPYIMTSESMTTMHGTNERLSQEDYPNMIRFFIQLITNSQENSIPNSNRRDEL